MWAIDELGVKYRRLDYGHGYESTNTKEYLAKNPMGRVPVIEDGSVCMFESAAILRYLGATYGDDVFWPSDPVHRGSLDNWAEWGKNTFTEAVLGIFVYDVRLSPESRDPQILIKAVEKLTPLAQIFDRRISKHQWIGGDDFTFADIACGHILYQYFTLSWERSPLTALS